MLPKYLQKNKIKNLLCNRHIPGTSFYKVEYEGY